MNIKEMVDLLMEYKEAYYNDEPLVSDEQFDQLEDELRKIDPNNDYFSKVGIYCQGEKVKHEYPMLSMAKAKSIEEVKTWLNKIIDKRVQLIVEPKIDGLSFSAVYENKKLKYIATRGDGVEGRIITHIVDYIDFPKIIDNENRIEVRGELYISQKSNFSNLNNKPLRNLAVGLINRKDTGLEDLKYISYVAYQLVGNNLEQESDNILYLNYLGFKTVKYYLFHSIVELNDIFEEYKTKLRKEFDYETDGMIIAINNRDLYEEINNKYVVSHHNFFNIALKPPSESKWTIVEDITWQVSKNGYVIPVVNIAPITIGGAIIQNVTANNYQNVKKLKINIGDEIHVSRSNEVIPYLIEVKNKKDKSKLIPIICPSCETNLKEKGVHLICENKDCPEKNIQLITSWCKQNKMDGFAENTIRLLYDNFIKNIESLYYLNMPILDKIKNLNGIGDKKINNLLKQIEKSKNMTIVEFLARLSIELVGEKAIVKLGIKSIEDFWNFKDDTYIIGKNLIQYRNENKDMIKRLLNVLNIIDIKQNNYIGNVAMTGSGPKTRNELIKDLNNMNYNFVDSINKDTNILLTDDLNGNSSKIQKAKKLNIEIKTYEEFFIYYK